MSTNFDPIQTEVDKQRFLENLWKAQALYRARAGQSVVLCSEEQEVENRHGKATVAKTFFNVYQRTAFLQEQKKVCLKSRFLNVFSQFGRLKRLCTLTEIGIQWQILSPSVSTVHHL